MPFSLLPIKCSAAPPSFRILPSVRNRIIERSSDNETLLDSSRKLEVTAENLIHGNKKHISGLSFQF